jgi:endonuclease/exonuclease/phosphatase family metal-dependent hydrolase
MQMRRIAYVAVSLLLLTAQFAGAEVLRVMTYNVRYPASGDGPDLWDKRKDLFVASVQAADPDIIGTQELFQLQGDYLVAKATEYKWFGPSRKGPAVEDEHMGVFYKTSKLRMVESGNFWLSETPETVGSVSWDMSLPRMVTWGLFELRGSKQRFYFYNTHLAHRRNDEDARIKSVRLIAERIGKLPSKVPVILTGDFNASADGEVHRVLVGAGLADVWDGAPFRFGPEHTFHGFKGTPDGRRIDWIFTRGSGVKAMVAETLSMHQNGRYPSDHFPVLAVLDVGSMR